MDLAGIRILDLSRLAPGSYTTDLLGSMGADVIKIEEPTIGDYARELDPKTDRGVGAAFEALNRGKRSVTLDLKDDRGREAFFRVAATADVVLESFRPGVVDRLGVGYDDVRDHVPDVVYCSLTGYGQDGPYRDRVGHDLNYVGFGGLLATTRDGGTPVMPGYPIADMGGGLVAALSIVGSLLSRELGDAGGEHLDVSMLDAVVSFSQVTTAERLAVDDPGTLSSPLAADLPCYNVYRTADDRYVTLAAYEPQFWEAFCAFVDREHLVDKQFADDPAIREAVREEVAAVFAERTAAEWEDRLGNRDVMFGLVLSPAEMVGDPQLRFRDAIAEPEAGLGVRFPARSSAGLAGGRGPSPSLGEHTDEVLRAVGYSGAEIRTLREEEVV